MDRLDGFIQTIARMQLSDYVDIAVVAFLIYLLLPLIRTPSTMRIARSVIVLLVVAWLTDALELYTLSFILNQFLQIGLLAFVILWILGEVLWILLVYALGVALITLLVLHSIWRRGRANYYIIAALTLCVFVGIYLSGYVFGRHNWWQCLLLIAPAELIVFCCSRLKQRKKPEK